MSNGKMIENPEVPGLEQSLPPPPPPTPSPPIISKIDGEINENEIEPSTLPVSAISSASTHSPTSTINSVVISLPIPSSNQPTPWWISTEADTQETYPQWLSQQEEATFVAAPLEKVRSKGVKRKCGSVDAAEDAECVANAQRELSGLMKPLKCDLCNAIMNSTLQAKLHYDGKPHQKKVSMFLNQSVKKLKTDEGPVTNVATIDWNTYCDVCKTWFTSQIDAAQHYAGKKHIKATAGVPKQKSPKKNSNQSPVDPTGKFGIGLSFQSEHQVISNINQLAGSLSVPSSPISSGFAPGAINYGAALRCDLCGVSANRLEQLETHRRGARHQKMLRLNGVVNSTSSSPEIECTAVATVTIDYSICRTPSGSYYCAPCNKSFNSENSFAQHIESKKHKNQINPKSTTNQSPSNARKTD